MLVISRRRGWVLALPIGRLVFSALAVWVLCRFDGKWYGHLIYGALALIGLALAVDGLRWVRRGGASLYTWQPELWAPLARRTLEVSQARLVVRLVAGYRWVSWKAELDSDPSVARRPLGSEQVCFADFPHYQWGKALAQRSARRVARALDLPPADTAEAANAHPVSVRRKKKKGEGGRRGGHRARAS
jgi:hypothetical protein